MSELEFASLLILDECRMIDERMARDVRSFGVPVLVLGDPAQLPPVDGGLLHAARVTTACTR